MVDSNDMTPLDYADFDGDLTMARLLLTFGTDPNFSSRRSPLQWAIQEGHLIMAQLLIDNKANLHETVDVPALHNACGFGNLAAVRLLRDAGTDVNWNVNGTALHTAAAYGHLEVVQALLAYGANIEVRNEEGQTPLFFANYTGGKAVTDLLLAAGASPTAVDNNGRNTEKFAWFTEEEDRALDGSKIP